MGGFWGVFLLFLFSSPIYSLFWKEELSNAFSLLFMVANNILLFTAIKDWLT